MPSDDDTRTECEHCGHEIELGAICPECGWIDGDGGFVECNTCGITAHEEPEILESKGGNGLCSSCNRNYYGW